MRYLSVKIAILFLLFFSFIPHPARAGLGDVVNELEASCQTKWLGGVTWQDGWLVESVRGQQHLYRRDPVTGEYGATIYSHVKYPSDVAWDSARNQWWLTDPFDKEGDGGYREDILVIPGEGGYPTIKIDTGAQHETGIFYDSGEDRIWVAHNVGSYIRKYKPNGDRDGDRIWLPFDNGLWPNGICRVGNHLWISTEHNDDNYPGPYPICQFELDGTPTGISFTLPHNSMGAGLTFDGKYLWTRGMWQDGAEKAKKGYYPARLYQIDLGDGPPPATTFKYQIDNLYADNAFIDLHDTDDAVFYDEGSWSYWCPTVQQEETEGIVVYRIDLPVTIETAELTAAGTVFWGNGELTVEVSTNNQTYHQLYHISRSENDSISNNETYEITSFVKGSSTVYVRARMRAWSSLCSQFLRGDPSAKQLFYLRGTGQTASSLPPIVESGDYNGDGRSDVAIFRPSSGLWSVRGITRVYFGGGDDIPVPGDYTGDNTTEIGIYRGSQGLWAIRGFTRVYFGSGSVIPVPGDYNGDGDSEIGIYLSESGLWAIRGITRVYFGGNADRPVPGDYTGDGRDDIAIYRDSSGLWAVRGNDRFYYGGTGDRAVPAAYGGGKQVRGGIFRPSSGLWAVRGLTRVYFGGSADQAVPADYNGDSTAEPGIFGPATGRWAIRGVTRVYFGSAGDLPVVR